MKWATDPRVSLLLGWVLLALLLIGGAVLAFGVIRA